MNLSGCEHCMLFGYLRKEEGEIQDMGLLLGFHALLHYQQHVELAHAGGQACVRVCNKQEIGNFIEVFAHTPVPAAHTIVLSGLSYFSAMIGKKVSVRIFASHTFSAWFLTLKTCLLACMYTFSHFFLDYAYNGIQHDFHAVSCHFSNPSHTHANLNASCKWFFGKYLWKFTSKHDFDNIFFVTSRFVSYFSSLSIAAYFIRKKSVHKHTFRSKLYYACITRNQIPKWISRVSRFSICFALNWLDLIWKLFHACIT